MKIREIMRQYEEIDKYCEKVYKAIIKSVLPEMECYRYEEFEIEEKDIFLKCVWAYRGSWDNHSLTIPVDVMEQGLDFAVEWYKNKVTTRKRKEEEKKKQQEELSRQRQEERDKIEYQRLKTKFEGDNNA